MRREPVTESFPCIMRKIKQQIENCNWRAIREQYEVAADRGGRRQNFAPNRLRDLQSVSQTLLCKSTQPT